MSNTRQVNFDNQASQVIKIGPLNITLLPKNYNRYNITFFSMASNQKNMLKTTEKVLEESRMSPKHNALTKILMKNLSSKYNELLLGKAKLMIYL